MIDDTDPGLSIPDRREGVPPWLVSLCRANGFEIRGPSPHWPGTFTFLDQQLWKQATLWIIGRSPLGAEALARFRDLILILGPLRHPGLWTIFNAGAHEGRPYLVLPDFEGRLLGDRLRSEPLTVDEAVGLAISLARAVHFVHEAGIVQLDLLVDSILLADYGTPQLDLRRTLERSVLEVEGRWFPGGVSGCEAPELIRGGEVGREVDVYAVGAILYRMLTGRAALIRDAGGSEAIRNILDMEPERPRLFNPRVDRSLESICLRCLEKDPRRRYGSAEALADDLERWRSRRTNPIVRLRRRYLGRSGLG